MKIRDGDFRHEDDIYSIILVLKSIVWNLLQYQTMEDFIAHPQIFTS